MFASLWFVFGILMIICDSSNPVTGLMGIIVGGVSLFVISCFVFIANEYRKRLGKLLHMRFLLYLAVFFILLMGIFVRTGVVFLTIITSNVTQMADLIKPITLLFFSILFQILMSASIWKKFKKY